MTRRNVLVALALLLGLLHGAAQAQSNTLLKEIESSFVRLHEKVGPCVVNIETESAPDGSTAELDSVFRFFGAPENGEAIPGRPARPRQTGSGFVYDRQGHIVTNNHVLEGAEDITVRFRNGNEYRAHVVGRDPETDLAVVKIDPPWDLPVARLGDSDVLRVGQFAVAIGSSRGFEGSVSFGHISALGREGLAELAIEGLTFQNLIQTDAAINLGNSGGPLCNIDGEVIGINTAVIWGANSIAFAIPINTAKTTIPALIAEGRVSRGYLGVKIDAATPYAAALSLPRAQGALVEWVEPETPAARAGLRVYDVITKVDGKPVEDADDLVRHVSAHRPETEVMLDIWRDEMLIQVEVRLSERQLGKTQPDREQEVLGMRLRVVTEQVREQIGLDPSLEGVLVTEVAVGGPAEAAGLVAGDVVLEVDRQTVRTPDDVIAIVAEHARPGGAILLRYVRGGREPDVAQIPIPGTS